MSLQCVSLWFRMRKKFWRLLKFLVRTRCIGRLGWVFSCVGDGSLVWILFCWWTLLYHVNGVHHHFAILFAALMCSVLRVRKHWAKDELSSLASIYRETSFYKCMYNCLKPKTLHQFSVELSFYLFRKKKKKGIVITKYLVDLTGIFYCWVLRSIWVSSLWGTWTPFKTGPSCV